MKTLIVRKGIETQPLIWGLKIPHFYLFLIISVLLGFTFVMVFAFSAFAEKWTIFKLNFIFLALSLATILFLKDYFGSKAKPNKTKFKKGEYHISNQDLLKSI